MAEFILTGFGDEIDASLDRQMEVMDGLGIHFIETRGIDGKNIADYTPEAFQKMMDVESFCGEGRGYIVESTGDILAASSSSLEILLKNPYIIQEQKGITLAMCTRMIPLLEFARP